MISNISAKLSLLRRKDVRCLEFMIWFIIEAVFLQSSSQFLTPFSQLCCKTIKQAELLLPH